MNPEQENSFVQSVRRELDRDAEPLDTLTVARLRAARLRALDARPRRLDRRVAGWSAAAVTIALTAVLLFHSPSLTPPRLEQIEWLAEADLDLVPELEFYQWLADEARTL